MAAKAVACSCYRNATPGPQLSATISAMCTAVEALNASTVMSLSCLPGIGGTTARKVVEARDAVGGGRFTDLKQVLAVPRCGRRIVSQLLGEEEFTKYLKLRCRADFAVKRNDISSAHGSYTAVDLVHGECLHAVCSTNVVSIDLGLSNAAWVHLTCNLDVLEWRKLSTAFPDPYNIEDAHTAVSGYSKYVLFAVKYHPSKSCLPFESSKVAFSYCGYLYLFHAYPLFDNSMFCSFLQCLYD